MPTYEQLKARFPHASEAFLRANAGVRSGSVAVAPAVPAVVRKVTTTDEDSLNKTEKRFLAVLRSRPYAFVGIKSFTLKLAFDCRYAPDFVTCDCSGGVVCWEAKGPFIYEKALYKPRMAANKFAFFRFVLAQEKEGRWIETLIKP